MAEGLAIDWALAGYAALALGLGALLQGFTGFGGGITGTALLSLVVGVVRATAVTNLCTLVLCWGMLVVGSGMGLGSCHWPSPPAARSFSRALVNASRT